ncbi:MAG: glycosyl hydrolase, partial [Niabella sp.]
MKLIIFLFTFLFIIENSAQACKKCDLVNFPKGYEPKEVGARLSERFLESSHLLHGGKWIHYAEVCTWYGALRFAETVQDQGLITKLQMRFDSLCLKEKELLPIMNHVDLNMFGCLPLELYKVTGNQAYLKLGMPYANSQWEIPNNPKPYELAWHNKGYSWQTRLWIDDMF